jgi:hypothetical protein
MFGTLHFAMLYLWELRQNKIKNDYRERIT